MPSRPPSREEINTAVDRLNKLIGERERQQSAADITASINHLAGLLGQNDPYIERQHERRYAIIESMKPASRHPQVRRERPPKRSFIAWLRRHFG